MAIANPHFETAGALPGEASDWPYFVSSAMRLFAGIDTVEETREDFSEGWRMPMGTPGVLSMGTYDVATSVFTDASAFVLGDEHPVLVVHVTAPTVGAVDVTVTYTEGGAVPVPGQTGTVTIPAGTPAGATFKVALTAGDSAPVDVTGIAHVGGAAGAIELVGVRSLLWCEGTPYAPEASGNTENEDALFAFVDALHLTAAVFTHGTTDESFEYDWSGNAGVVFDDFDLLGQADASFDAVPALVAEGYEDFEEGWRSPKAERVTLGSYRVSNNSFVVGSAGPDNNSAYPLSANARARITEAFTDRAMSFTVTYKATAGGGDKTGTLVIPKNAAIGQIFSVLRDVPADHPASNNPASISAVTEVVLSVALGRFALEADLIPAIPDQNAAVVWRYLNATLLVGAGAGAVRYLARADGVPAPSIRVEHVSVPGTAVTTAVAAVAGAVDITVDLRTSAAGVVLATADEVAEAVNMSETASPYVVAEASGTGAAGVAAIAPLALQVPGVEAALFDGAAEAFEDFEEGWSNNENCVADLGLETPHAPGHPEYGMYYERLDPALFDSATLFGTYDGPTDAYAPTGAEMAAPPYTEMFLARMDTPFTIGVGAPALNVHFTAVLPGAGLTEFNTAALITAQAGAAAWVALDPSPPPPTAAQAYRLDTADTHPPPPAATFATGACRLYGGAVAETFEGDWTLVLT